MDALQAVATVLAGVGGTALFLMPGYILSRTYGRGVRGAGLSDQAFIATAALGALVTHALTLWWTVPLLSDVVRAGLPQAFGEREWGLYARLASWALVVLIAVPATLGAAFTRLTDVTWPPIQAVLGFYSLSAVRRAAEAWTWVFADLDRKGERRWLKIRLKDGRDYLGLFGADSLASAEVKDLYLQEWWDLDGAGQAAVTQTPNRGVWLSADQVVAIEFYDGV